MSNVPIVTSPRLAKVKALMHMISTAQPTLAGSPSLPNFENRGLGTSFKSQISFSPSPTGTLRNRLASGIMSPRAKRKFGEVSNYQVFVRVRPYLPHEVDEGIQLIQPEDEDKIIYLDKTTLLPKETFVFNRVFWDLGSSDGAADQEMVFEACGVRIVDSALEGYNGSILAYGQTSSGKTHTMMGREGTEDGIIPKLCKRLFSSVDSSQGSGVCEISIEVSFMEIYNEQVLDLLDQSSHTKLRVRNHPVTGVFVDGLFRAKVESWEDAVSYIKKGNHARHVGSTKMNEQSSRSHAIFQIYMTQSTVSVLGTSMLSSTIHLVDLAGSERVKQSAVEGERFRETTQINQSLSTLRRVIDALVTKNKIIPFRESTLTWILSESFGGNAHSFLIATLCPHSKHSEETYNTLQYAHRAKEITNHVTKNEDNMARLIRELEEQVKSADYASTAEDLDLKREMMEHLQGKQKELEDKYAAMQFELESARQKLEKQSKEKMQDDQVRETMSRRVKETEQILIDERSLNMDRMTKIRKKYDSVKAQLATQVERCAQLETSKKTLETENMALKAEVQNLHTREVGASNSQTMLVQWMVSAQCKMQTDYTQYEEASRAKLEEYEKAFAANAAKIAHRNDLLESQLNQLKFEVDLLHRDRISVRSSLTTESEKRNAVVEDLKHQLRQKEHELERAHSALADVCSTYVQVSDFMRSGTVPPPTVTTKKVLEVLREFCSTWSKHNAKAKKALGVA